MNAIATYVAWIVKFKESLQTNNKTIAEMAEMLRQRWLIQADQARSPEYLTQNDFNEIADAKSSWNRKVYGRSTPPLMK